MRSSSDMTGLITQGVAGLRGSGSARACGLATAGGPGSIRRLTVAPARQLTRSCSLITGFTSHGPVGRSSWLGSGGGATRACGFTTSGGGGALLATGAARQLTRSCSLITGCTMQGPFGLSVSAGATGGGAGRAGAGLGATTAGFGATMATGGGETGAGFGATTAGGGGGATGAGFGATTATGA